jgi:hypothetical protein
VVRDRISGRHAANIRRPECLPAGENSSLRVAETKHGVAVALLAFVATSCLAQSLRSDNAGVVAPVPSFARLHIPHLQQAPRIADFAGMRASPTMLAQMLKFDGFTQRDPHDGTPISQRTEVYLGYSDKNLYVVCLCFDSEPGKIRARLGRRELINDDDQFGFVLDTFHDKKHGVFFFINPEGVQQDGIWNDATEPDYSFDLLWNSDAQLNESGYIAWFEIPFKSLRFSPATEQTWGVFFERDIKRNNEYSFYPRITSNAQGFLSQETEADGLSNISPGRNLQFIPYASFRSFRTLDDRDPNQAFFQDIHAQGRFGLDSKVVIKDALVLDATVNPDFAQVESDDPQVTVNQRFEVFFPEKRPFFQENASYFDTPMQLVFTRRITDPEYGVRLTGKVGPWAIGWLFADDKRPTDKVPIYDPLSGHKAHYTILRVNHDIGKESTFGFIFTDRELHTVPNTICTDDPCVWGSNRVGGFDTKIKINGKWSLTAQAVVSHSKLNDGTHKGGPAYWAYLQRSSTKLEFNTMYQDTAEGFETDTGFFRRPDIRRFSNFAQYRFRREGKILQWHGPSIFTINNWDHHGTRLEYYANANYRWNFSRQTDFGFFGNLGHERLRPADFDTLTANRDYAHHHSGVFFHSGYFKQLIFETEISRGTETNYDPMVGPPVLAKSSSAEITATVRPTRRLSIDNTYFLTRLRDNTTGQAIFNNHIIRSKWNYQFTRAFSLRLIPQYTAVLSNRSLTSLQTTKQFNLDFLLTYLPHPGTAIYVGYNSDLQNFDRSLRVDPIDPDQNLLRASRGYLNDGRALFVKVSYLFRY